MDEQTLASMRRLTAKLEGFTATRMQAAAMAGSSTNYTQAAFLDAAVGEAQAAETERIEGALAAGKQAAAADAIPTFFRPRFESRPDAALAAAGEASTRTEAFDGAGLVPPPPTATLTTSLLFAAREVEQSHYLAVMAAWDTTCSATIWEMLNAAMEPYASPTTGGATISVITFAKFTRVSAEFRRFLDGYETKQRHEMGDAAYQEQLTYRGGASLADALLGNGAAADPRLAGNVFQASLHVAPRFDAGFFLSCPRLPNGSVELFVLYSALVRNISIFKALAELLMRDGDGDGCLFEEEVEDYVRDLWPHVACLRTVTEEFVPVYTGAVVRRMLWALGRGSHGVMQRSKVHIGELVAHPEMKEWIAIQLSANDIPGNFYGLQHSMALYSKFVSLDVRGGGMVRRCDMDCYKRGVPPPDDGLPADCSPYPALFLDRYFEAAVLYAGEMDYKCFVDFALNVDELPACPRPGLFFDIFDLDGDGLVTATDAAAFFRETHGNYAGLAQYAMAPEVVVSEAFDLLITAAPLRATRAEFCASPQAGTFCAVLINHVMLETYERRESSVGDKQDRLMQYQQVFRR
jgi:hypothetical protein